MSRILLVEDEPDLRELICDMVSLDGIDCELAGDGQEALDKIKVIQKTGLQIDLILSDISMPRMNGFDLLREVRNLKINIPMVFLSGHADKQLEKEALERGAVGIQYKPFKTDQLIAYIHKIIESSKA